jgi:hypothetical protein
MAKRHFIELAGANRPRRCAVKPWQQKADRLIGEYCLAAWREANPIGRKRHKPYSVPEVAQELAECLDTNDELRAKQLFQLLAFGGVL